MNFFAENLQVFKKVFLPLFALVVLSSNIDQYLNLHIENALRDPMGAQSEVYLFGFISLIFSVIFPVILTCITLYALNTRTGWTASLGDFLGKHLNQVFIETLRSWGKSLLWSLLLILPGIWKYIQYSLVPFVVTSSQQYDEGREDALKKSATIVRRHWVSILFVLVFFHLILPLVVTTLFDAYRLVWKTPLQSLALSGLDTYLFIISTHILFNIFRSEVKNHESHV
ncbi:MAG TPA: hypothetical protein VGE46_03800 [Bdellovibrio sp.]